MAGDLDNDGDVDSDGDQDIVMCGVVWFENPGTESRDWTQHRVARQRGHDIEVGDLDGDGRLDIVSRDQSAFGGPERGGNALYLYYQDATQSWTGRQLSCPHGEGIKLGDLDRDGDPDIVIGDRWYKNPRTRNTDAWQEHLITDTWTEPDTKVELADMNQDGRLDVVLAPSELQGEMHKLAFYAAPTDPTSGAWREQVIVEAIECVVHGLGVGDLDNDGDIDVAISEMDQGTDPDEVCVLLNSDNGTTWSKLVLSVRGSHDIVVADIDGDGDLDIFGANHARHHPLELWRNNLK